MPGTHFQYEGGVMQGLRRYHRVFLSFVVLLTFHGVVLAPPDPIIHLGMSASDPGRWTIDGEDAEPFIESELTLNSIAFGLKEEFKADVKNGSGGHKQVHPFRMTGTFRHCSTTTTTHCSVQANCPTGESCVTTTLELEVVSTLLGEELHWYLINASGTRKELQPETYSSAQVWRAEFCGALASDIVVYWMENGVVVSDAVPEDKSVTIQTQ